MHGKAPAVIERGRIAPPSEGMSNPAIRRLRSSAGIEQKQMAVPRCSLLPVGLSHPPEQLAVPCSWPGEEAGLGREQNVPVFKTSEPGVSG